MILALLPLAAAEGFSLQADNATLMQSTTLHILVQAPTEHIFWLADAPAQLITPDGTLLGTFTSFIDVAGVAGVWTVTLTADAQDWIAGAGNAPAIANIIDGRVFSYQWDIDTPSSAFTDWLYVPVPLGDAESPEDGAVALRKLDLERIVGSEMSIIASRIGITAHPGYSIDSAQASPSPELPIFLSYPAQYDTEQEVATALTDFTTTYSHTCEQVVPGYTTVTFSIDSPLYGTSTMICDVDEDGDYDISGAVDLVRMVQTDPGIVSEEFDGTDTFGEVPVTGTFTCAVGLQVGPLHTLLLGADSAAPGVRQFSADSPLSSSSLSIFWNDSAIEDTVLTADGSLPLVYSGSGIHSGSYRDEGETCTEANPTDCTSHGWGDVGGSPSLRADAWVDTWSIDDFILAGTVTLTIADLAEDADKDTIPSPIEECLLGTDPLDNDTDGDGLGDRDEVAEQYTAPPDTDSDGTIDALDEDDDNDGVPTSEEVSDTSRLGLSADLNGNGTANWHDTDADGDGIGDGDERDDADGSGIPDYLEFDEARDTGAPQGPHDSGAPPQPTRGQLQGGARQCGAVSGGGLLWLAGLVVLRRRR